MLDECFNGFGIMGVELKLAKPAPWWQFVQFTDEEFDVMKLPFVSRNFMGWIVSLLLVLMWHRVQFCVPLCFCFVGWHNWQYVEFGSGMEGLVSVELCIQPES